MRAVSTDARGPQASATGGPGTETRPEQRSVLVVDDAPMLRRAIAEMLAHQGGFAVREAGTYREAEALLGVVDAVATDGHYPHHVGEATAPWGLVLARLARARGKQAVLVSADSVLIEQAHGEGIQALTKPGGILGVVAALAKGGVGESVDLTVR
jgi:CheY-like chemotaxis protein